MKTGGWGGEWIELERPKPPPVDDRYRWWWPDRPPELSPRCVYWGRQIERGWRPNRRIEAHCFDCSALWYGVYIWEYIHVISPLLLRMRQEWAEEQRYPLRRI